LTADLRPASSRSRYFLHVAAVTVIWYDVLFFFVRDILPTLSMKYPHVAP